ncbi:MAG: hypothetical protein E7271_05825 [Lachnospiraceae bacterium]|jgi:hypothetical protein|nr:hypothetical protein [Lachnospiraceae bacterium]
MKTKKTSLFLSIIMIACLVTGCAFGGFDASAYVKSCLDANLHGEFEEYAKITNSEVSEVEDLYNSFLDTDLSFLSVYKADDETKAKFRELFIKLYKNTKYEVGEATKDSDGNYTVPVKVYKMDVFKNVMANIESDMQTWAEAQVATGTTPSTDDIYAYVLDYMYDAISKEVDAPQYEDPTDHTIKVSKNSSNAYEINQTELQNLLESMIDLENAQ